ncbi:iron complex outermembrane receptor protein [Brevundimonas vesicularis]|uniref:TonB-dependent receptor n=1 Tax=Brevundimonas vesicularis TaxID=41276 RepID=UPI0027895BE9|nr:TonB-dependent receptor [Brevundimonas vesicularis]MDQ1192153.1 iron complex outermembrane receptor protein [Brevundimonas vesicularis]
MRRTNTRTLCAVGVSLAALMGASAAVAQALPASEPVTQDAAQDATVVDEIVVTGFRSSLQQALNIKRREAGAVDAILAEDMADFPDQNLAEAIQRLPGVTIDRVNGQGTTISVRGLGSDFTRTRINGLEAQAASGGNRNRSFDFSMFASELFNSIKVRKTQSAEIEEGSLGATVDLQTGRPLDFGGSGLNSALSVQGSYNDLSEKTVPRLAGLLSWSNEDRTFGALVSIAYSERSPILGSFNTTRWQKGDPSNVNAAGNPYGRGQNFGGCIPCTTTAQRDAVLNAFYPRIPRYTLGNTQEDRLGMTGALQWRPSDRTEAVLDVLWSRFNSELESPNIEAWSFSRANVNSVVVRDYAIDADKNILSYGVFDNMLVRAENGFTRNESNFYQASLNVRHDFSDRLHGNLKVGANRSEARTPLNVAYAFEAAGVNGYTFDFREDDRRPRINYGFDVTSGQRFTLVNATRSNAGGNFDNKVGAGSLAYDWSDSLTFKIGGEYRTYGFETFGLTRTKTSPTGADRLTGVDSIGRVVSIGDGVSAGAGSDLSFIVPDISKIADFLSFYDDPLVPNRSEREVDETDKGVFLQADFNTTVGGMVLRGNAGIRYAQTEVTAKGWQTIAVGTPPVTTYDYVTTDNDYDDVLPSFNLALEPRDDVVIRLGAAKVMSRPTLGDLTPGGSVSPTTRTVSYGNPLLDPFRATNYDFSVEWYFQNEGLLAAAVFYKDIDSFITSETVGIPYNQLGLPNELLQGAASPTDIFQVTRRLNGEGGALKGIEIQYQQPFTFLPGLWSNFGFTGNVTWVDSEVSYGTAGKNRLTGQSKNTANATLYYEDGPFQARVSVAHRSQYLLSFPGANGNSEEGVNDTTNVDASMSYEFTPNLTFSLEGINLTDAYTDRYVDVTNRVSDYRHTGREIAVGLRWKY